MVHLSHYRITSPPPCPPTHGPPVSPPVSLSSLVNNYMIWTLVQKTVASLDQRFENAQDKLLESLIGTKKVRFPGFPWIRCEMKPVVLHCCVCKGQVIHRCPCFGFVAVLHPTLADVYRKHRRHSGLRSWRALRQGDVRQKKQRYCE